MKCPNPKCGNITRFETEAFEVSMWDYTIKLTYENNRALIDDDYQTSNPEYVSGYMTPKNTTCTCPECNFVGPIKEFVENHEGVNHHGFLEGYEHKSMVVYETTGHPRIPLEKQKLREIINKEPPLLTWHQAYKSMLNLSKKVSRKKWGHYSRYLYIKHYILRDEKDATYLGRLSGEDVQATDWFVVEGE